MSISVESRKLPGVTLVRFMEDGAVALKSVPDSLNVLWRNASETLREETHHALARACLWNLVAYSGTPGHPRESSRSASRIETLLEEVTARVPGRVIHLEQWDDDAPRTEGTEVEARVGTHCLHSGPGPHMVCCEQINLSGYGDRGRSHFAAGVRSLLVPDLPVALLWLDEVPRKGRLLAQLLELSDRLIIDSQRTHDAESLLAVRDLQAATPGKVTDLSWLRLKPLRYLVADCFDPPERAEQLAALEGLTLETTEAGRNTGLLLAGWLLSRCGCGPAKAEDAPEGMARWRVPRADGKAFPLQMAVKDAGSGADGPDTDRDGGLDGILRIEILAGGDRFELHDVDAAHMAVTTPDRTLPSVPLRESDEPGLVAEALAARLHDTIYAEALAAAAELVESEQWTR